MYIIVILIFSLLLVSFITVLIKLLLNQKQIRDIARQIREFREKKTGKKITTEIYDKDIENLAYETNEFLELYRKSEQEKVQFENTLQQGIANMSHDLRTPLTSIIGYLKLLQNDEINKEEALGVIKNKTDKLNVLINDFFELAFIESNDYKLKITKLNLTNIIRDEILSFYEAFETKGIEPIINIPKESIFINGDKNSLERIIDNLLSNTLKYSQKYVEINVEEFRGTVTLSISNICTYIDEKDVIYMFDRFYRADKVRKGQGTGLGLSIAKSLMEKMNGSIRSNFENNKITIVCEWGINKENGDG
ncbi:sensor histidine kinase [Haloimpatiens massiliensis]|uniref:sensor histidine kinase n=1 Tax=Haloimpatiens massiliensis TaxID=1658110 RepID=UPI000C8197D4|nr:HAMP domain-containing sensor histidine kinase [Haloimpatiens massiliensis]